MRWACRCCSVGYSRADEQHDAHGQVAWSWHPDADALRKARKRVVAHGGQKARRTGENAKQPLNPSRGECRDVSAEPVVPAASIFFAGGPWVRPAPGIPRALCLKGAVQRHSSDAETRREKASSCLNTVIASEATQSRAPSAILDCFASLAMTLSMLIRTRSSD